MPLPTLLNRTKNLLPSPARNFSHFHSRNPASRYHSFQSQPSISLPLYISISIPRPSVSLSFSLFPSCSSCARQIIRCALEKSDISTLLPATSVCHYLYVRHVADTLPSPRGGYFRSLVSFCPVAHVSAKAMNFRDCVSHVRDILADGCFRFVFLRRAVVFAVLYGACVREYRI